MKQYNQKRTLERYNLELLSLVSIPKENGEQNFYNFQTGNISSGGAFFYTKHALPLGTEVNVEVIIPLNEIKKMDADKTLIRVSGKVVRNENEGMAVSFNKNYEIVSVSFN
ncbi:PilZ domain-containing protein [Desulfonema limicola]|uniref:PilZ domain-containing protein n=1 Tax=Desulfonema limicola TaxID=45656 RepID=A0A975B4S1_9BACT|nr:PilZ domain-containing protein [Desulfonema limicola]QTA78790.1 PilZ domain-containing protein [Desulfonema limicola]